MLRLAVLCKSLPTCSLLFLIYDPAHVIDEGFAKSSLASHLDNIFALLPTKILGQLSLVIRSFPYQETHLWAHMSPTGLL